MKKLSYILGCCVALFSCTREIEKIEPETIEYPNVAEVNDLPTNIPSTLISNLAAEDDADTKTAYEGGKSKWAMGDVVCLLYVDNLTTPSNQGWIAYSVTNLENDDRMATFTIVSGQEDKITALSSYQSTGVALYPSNAARPYTANTEAINSDFGHKPFMTIQTTQTGNYADVVMLGKTAVVDGSTLTVDFKTAMSILKVSVSDIPAEAAKFQLYSSDADVYPTGDFLIDINADAPLELTKDSYHTWGGGKHSGSQSITINRTTDWDDGEQTFYLNVPTGAYEAGAITLKLLDGSDNLLMEKPIKSDFTFERNKMITGISLAAEWTTLGTGKYADYWMQGYRDVVEEMWDVTIQKSTSGRTYRIVNPYSKGENLVQTEAHDNYLYFTINEDTSVSFENHITGVLLDYNSVSYNTMLAFVSADGHKNKVLVGEVDAPEIIQLAPVYKDKDSDSFKNTRNMRDYMIRLVMPGFADKYTTSVSITGDASGASWSYTAPSTVKTIFFISNKSYSKYIYDAGNSDINPVAGTFSGVYFSNKTGTDNLSYSGTNMKSKSFVSGPVYISWLTYEGGSYENKYMMGSKKFYFLNPDDVSAWCIQHISTGYKSSTQTEALAGSYTFAVSDNPTTSNIKMIEYDGLTCDVSALTIPAEHHIRSACSWAFNTTYTGDNPSLTNGTAQYGILSGSNALLDASKPFFKNGKVNVYLYSYTDYAGGGRGAANDPKWFKFSISDGKVNVGETYVNTRFDGNNQASAPYANTITQVTE